MSICPFVDTSLDYPDSVSLEVRLGDFSHAQIVSILGLPRPQWLGAHSCGLSFVAFRAPEHGTAAPGAAFAASVPASFDS
jgi:hypothetical protein